MLHYNKCNEYPGDTRGVLGRLDRWIRVGVETSAPSERSPEHTRGKPIHLTRMVKGIHRLDAENDSEANTQLLSGCI